MQEGMVSQLAFEKFEKSKAVLGRRPNVTIQARGIISINQSAYERMGRPSFVDLMYDVDTKRVGIVGTDDEQEGHRVRVADQKGASAIVSGTAFTNYYDIPNKKTLRWEPEFEGRMLIIDLKVPGKAPGKRRQAASEEPNDDEI